MNAVLLVLALASADPGVDPAPTAPAVEPAVGVPGRDAVDPTCRDQLDATAACKSPAWETTRITADVKPEPPALLRDPSMLTGELGFFSTIIGLTGAGLLAGSQLRTDDSAASNNVSTGLFYGGVVGLTLSGLMAGAALSTWVFDPSTGALRLKIFEGEPR